MKKTPKETTENVKETKKWIKRIVKCDDGGERGNQRNKKEDTEDMKTDFAFLPSLFHIYNSRKKWEH